MNYLAHVFLASHSAHAMVGALLGDFVKGSDYAGFPPEVAGEIRLHRLIDAYTNRHPTTLAAKALFQPAHRRFAGIVLDVFYDHLLTVHWPRYSDEPLDDLVERFHAALAAHHALLPPDLAAIAPRMIAQRWLAGHGDTRGFTLTVERMSRRLSRGQELLVAAGAELPTHRAAIEAGFAAFMPELIRFTQEARQEARRAAPGGQAAATASN